MTTITLKNQTIHTIGQLPSTGHIAPDFELTKNDLTEMKLQDISNKKIILSIFPSLDTDVCAASVRKFNTYANSLPDVVILCISADLPFAQKRFCVNEGLENVIPLSVFRHPEFGKNYGVTMTDGPLAGLLSRAIVAIDKDHRVIWAEQVPEITQEPNYDAVISAIKKL